MNKSLIVSLCLFPTLASGDPELKKKVKVRLPTLKSAITQPVVVKAVIAENKKGKSLKSIQDLDKKWRNAVGTPPFIQKFIDNPCGKKLLGVKAKHKYIEEIFVMDNQGAVVCESDKTSDYWQGDEAKWKNSYNNGKGKDFIDEPEFDESSQAFLIQVSFPVFDKSKKTIGAVTVGINLDKM